MTAARPEAGPLPLGAGYRPGGPGQPITARIGPRTEPIRTAPLTIPLVPHHWFDDWWSWALLAVAVAALIVAWAASVLAFGDVVGVGLPIVVCALAVEGRTLRQRWRST